MISQPELNEDIEYFEPEGTPSVRMIGTSTIRQIIQEGADSILDAEYQPVYSALAGHVMSEFRINKDAKRNSGVEDEITSSLAQYNGKYTAEDLVKIRQEKGSDIFMNITSTKCRAAASWIRDILMAINSKSWKIKPTPKASLPESVIEKIESSIDQEFKELTEKPEEPQAPPQPQAPPPQQAEGQAPAPPTET